MSPEFPKIIVVAGFSNYNREYPDYTKKFGEQNVHWTTNRDRYTVEEHLAELKSKIPKDQPYILSGHSMGGALIIELMKREKIDNCKGIVLVGASRRIFPHWALNFIFHMPIPIIYLFAITLVISFPISLIVNLFNLHKAKQASFEAFQRIRDCGARRMKKEFNLCLRDLGKDTEDILEVNKNIPVLFLRLKKDMMLREWDIKLTKSFFNNWKEIIIPSDCIHLTHDFDDKVAELINRELSFFS